MTKILPEWIKAAQAAQARWLVPASISLAQFGVESGWGRHLPPGSNNPFGIKARAGQASVGAMTWEVFGGRTVHLKQQFRKFGSLDEAFDYHGRLLHDGRAYAGAMKAVGRPKDFAHALTGVYATDPHYGASLIALMDALDLYQYDKPASPSHQPEAVAAASRPKLADPSEIARGLTGMAPAPDTIG